MANYIKILLHENGLVGCEYAEPYAGGASVALSMLFEEYVDHIHINDFNRSIFAFWSAVVDQTDELCGRIADAKLTTEEWELQKSYQEVSGVRSIDLAFSTFYLNRTSRSGIIQGGLIGGKEQQGPWKMDARFNKEELIARIQKIGRFRSRITVTGLDAFKYLRDCVPSVNKIFLYLDPPYFLKGEGLYENFYGPSDHRAISHIVSRLTTPWIVSYDDVPEISVMYSGYRSKSYLLSYSASERRAGMERMFYSNFLSIPDIDSPSRVQTSELHRALAG